MAVINFKSAAGRLSFQTGTTDGGKIITIKFFNIRDKKVTLTVDEPKTDLTKEEVEAAMDEIIEARLFEVEDYLLASAVSAKIVEREVIELF